MTAGRRAVVLVPVSFVLFALLGLLVVALNGTTYRSTAVLAIDQPALLAGVPDPGPVQKLVMLRGQYTAVLTTRAVTDPIAARAGLPAAVVARSVRANAASDSLLIAVSADASAPGRARLLAGLATDELVRYAAETQRGAGVPPDSAVVLNVVDAPGPAGAVTGGTRTVITVALFLGVCGAAVTAAAVTLIPRVPRGTR